MHFTENQHPSCHVSIRALTIVFLVVFCVGSTPVHSQDILTQEDIENALKEVAPRTYCSHELITIMKFVCRYRQHVKPPSKKSMNNHNNDLIYDMERIGASNYDDYLAEPYSVIERGQRYRRGIIDECCNNPCYKFQLVKYCNKPNTQG